MARAISQERLWSRMTEMARIGGLPGGGVNRQALTVEDADAQALLLRWAVARGFSCFRDEIGNVSVRREGRRPDARPVLAGSHLDSRPAGGGFDGAYGVLAALELLETLEDLGMATERPVEAVSWTNHEGARFQPAAMGSGVFAGSLPLQAVLPRQDRDGQSVAAGLVVMAARAPVPFRAMASVKPAGYVEVHVGHGPLLEEAGAIVGVVSGGQGVRQFGVEVVGREAHAGTTPHRLRQDALAAAVAAVSALSRAFADPHDILRFTVGELSVSPGSPDIVPGRVHFSVDLRHPDDEVLAQSGGRVAALVEAAVAEHRCTAEVSESAHVRPVRFAPEVVELVRAVAADLDYASLDLVSGASHDATHLARLCPSGLVFVPGPEGISHNEAESAIPADLAAGARVLAATVVTLAGV